jgi:hypothetical protein
MEPPVKPVALAIAVMGLMLSSPSPSRAKDIAVGIGKTDFSSKDAMESALMIFELHADPFRQAGLFSLSWAVAADVDGEGNYWIGAGLAALVPLGAPENWFVEGSVMPGYYHANNSGNDLGGDLEFRSLLGVGRKLNERSRISLAIQHKSNASTGNHNPGVNSAVLRLRTSF